MQTPDEDLAQAAATGDRAAYAALVERHYDRLFAFAIRLTGARELAEDLTQDILVELPRKLRSFRRRAKFTTWLYRVAVNAAHDQRRRAATRQKAAEGWGDWEVARLAEVSEDKAARDWLSIAMTALPDDLRETAILLLGEDLTQAEAADVLGISPGTVAWRMSEAKKTLRALAQAEEAP